jgi:hypothetical protein
VPDAIWLSPWKFSRLEPVDSNTKNAARLTGKKTAEICPNMTVFAYLKTSDGIGKINEDVLWTKGVKPGRRKET